MENKVETVERRGGNTKLPRPNQYKRWCFTLNNYTEIEEFNIIERLDQLNASYIIGREIGELELVPHLQGYVELVKRLRWSELKLSERIHWEHAKGTRNDNLLYCAKENNFICKHIRPIACIMKLYEWQLNLEKIARGNPNGRTIYWVVDEKGGKGKSSFCKYLYVKYRYPTIHGGKFNDIIHMINNLPNIPNTLLIDIPRAGGNVLSYSAIECILNGMVFSCKYETEVKVFNPPNIIVFSNFFPDYNKFSEDRWNVITI